jgi:hypothetical protein
MNKTDMAVRYGKFVADLTTVAHKINWEVRDLMSFAAKPKDDSEWFQNLGFMPPFGISDETRLPVFVTAINESIEIAVLADGLILIEGSMISLGGIEIYTSVFKDKFGELTPQLKALYENDPEVGIGRKNIPLTQIAPPFN